MAEHKTPLLFGEPIRRTFTMKILGMKISHTRNAGFFHKYLLRKTTRQWARIKHAMGHSKFFSISRWLQLMNSKVRPHLEYLSGSWGYYLWGKADTVYTKYLKTALGHEKNSPVTSVYEETGFMPISFHRHSRMLKLWSKILAYPKDHFIRMLYESDRKIQSSRWAGKIRAILKAYGLREHWTKQSSQSENKTKWAVSPQETQTSCHATTKRKKAQDAQPQNFGYGKNWERINS